MRIHLSLDPSHLVQPVAGPSSGPLVNIGGDLVLIELQGELNHEGDNADGVVGVLGLDRPDKPTLHLGEHHLLHGKIATLAKPYAIIRRALVQNKNVDGAVEGDAEEEDDLEDDSESVAKKTPGRPTPTSATNGKGKVKGKGKGRAVDDDDQDEEEEEGPLFPLDPEGPLFQTPTKNNHGRHPSSSPSTIYPSSAIKDYSSELDFSSPPISEASSRGHKRGLGDQDDENGEDDGDEDGSPEVAKKRKSTRNGDPTKKQRTRRYEVVGVVRKKIVFALRPEPIVTATILPD